MVERMIHSFIPEHYDIFWDINRETKSFQGKVKITGEALQDTIRLHQHGLDIKYVAVNDEVADFTLDNENDGLSIFANISGAVKILIEFSAKITDNMDGIYPCYYTHNGAKKELVATQFESHFARQAFPCADEPLAKATFAVSIKFDEKPGEVCLSNMPEINAEERKGTGIWRFETTPRMSTYLLAFVLGELHSVEAQTKNDTTVAVYSTKAHDLNSLEYALDIAVRSIEFYEEYYGVEYPLPQSLQVALPDFSAGAMENWGLVTYREAYLVADENSTQSAKEQIALTIAHELAHQWFGNLVTMEWWDNLWLNESFANMMEYLAIDNLEPNLNIWESFQTSDAQAALNRDATDGVQSVQVEVNHPDEINTIFDGAIVYAKGSRLLQMLRTWLGDEDFRAGLNMYFQKHQYGNTTGEDLWGALSESSGKDVSSFMNPWIQQSGYPVLTVTLEDNVVKYSQKQFFIGEHEDNDRLWPLPLAANWDVVVENLAEESASLDDYSAHRENATSPLLFNQGNTAHYIVNYEGTLWDDIVENFADLDEISKYQIAQDRRLLAMNGTTSHAELVELARLLKDENSFILVEALAEITAALKVFVDEGTELAQNYKTFLIEIYADKYQNLGFTPKDSDKGKDEQIRQIVVSELLYADYQAAINDASAVFAEHEADLANVPASVRSLVLSNEVRHNESPELINLFLDDYVNTNSASYKAHLRNALANTREETTVELLLNTWKNRDIVKPQDLASWYYAFLRHDFTKQYAWDWARENWAWVMEALGGDMSSDRFITFPAYVFKTEERLSEYMDFFYPELDNLAFRRNILMGINQIQARIKLIYRDGKAIAEILA